MTYGCPSMHTGWLSQVAPLRDRVVLFVPLLWADGPPARPGKDGLSFWMAMAMGFWMGMMVQRSWFLDREQPMFTATRE